MTQEQETFVKDYVNWAISPEYIFVEKVIDDFLMFKTDLQTRHLLKNKALNEFNYNIQRVFSLDLTSNLLIAEIKNYLSKSIINLAKSSPELLQGIQEEMDRDERLRQWAGRTAY